MEKVTNTIVMIHIRALLTNPVAAKLIYLNFHLKITHIFVIWNQTFSNFDV